MCHRSPNSVGASLRARPSCRFISDRASTRLPPLGLLGLLGPLGLLSQLSPLGLLSRLGPIARWVGESDRFRFLGFFTCHRSSNAVGAGLCARPFCRFVSDRASTRLPALGLLGRLGQLGPLGPLGLFESQSLSFFPSSSAAFHKFFSRKIYFGSVGSAANLTPDYT